MPLKVQARTEEGGGYRHQIKYFNLLFRQYLEVSHPTERLLHSKMKTHIAPECLEAIHCRKACIRERVPR